MDANFSPSFLNYNGKGSFVFWAQKVIPLVYDNSLSYYETLCKVVDYLNNVVENLDKTQDNLDSLHGAYDELEAWVNETINTLGDIYVTHTQLTSRLNGIIALINEKQDILTFDNTPTAFSSNPVTSNGIFNALGAKADMQYSTPEYEGSMIRIDQRGYMSVADYDAVRTVEQTLGDRAKATARANIGAISLADIGTIFTIKGSVANVAALPDSGNTVGDVYYVESESTCYVWITTSSYPTGNWEELGSSIDLSNYVTTADFTQALSHKQNTLTWDNTPTVASPNPVTSGGIYTALGNKLNRMYTSGTYTAGDILKVNIQGEIENVADESVHFTTQSLTTLEAKQARQNIGAASEEDLSSKADKTTFVTIASSGGVTASLDEDKVYIFSGALSSLNILLNAGSATVPKYRFMFDTPLSLFSITLPQNVIMPDNWVIKENFHYEVEINGNYGTFNMWPLS